MGALHEVVQEALTAEHRQAARTVAEEDAHLVEDAAAYAAAVLGAEAAATLGTWMSVDAADAPADTAQAVVDLGPGAVLIYAEYTDPGDGDGRSLTLAGTCTTCGHHEDVAVRSLTGLGQALRQTGGTP